MHVIVNNQSSTPTEQLNAPVLPQPEHSDMNSRVLQLAVALDAEDSQPVRRRRNVSVPDGVEPLVS